MGKENPSKDRKEDFDQKLSSVKKELTFRLGKQQHLKGREMMLMHLAVETVVGMETLGMKVVLDHSLGCVSWLPRHSPWHLDLRHS